MSVLDFKMDLLHIRNILISNIGYLENSSTLCCTDLPNVDTLHYTISNHIPLNHRPPHHKCLEVLGSWQAHSGRYSFSKF